MKGTFSMETDAIFVYVACGTLTEARKIAAYCVKERLAACGNIFPQMESVYWWDDDIQSEQESVLILKTQKNHFSKLEKAVKSLHSYECPCICALPVAAGAPSYLAWIQKETS
jgi:periplasmic divalent cation tolerance protein